jgi:hypothetical protein
VCQPVAEVVIETNSEDLCLAFKAAEGSRVNYAIPIALKVGPVGVRWFRIAASG